MLSTSILKIQNAYEKIKEIDDSNTDYIHFDVMDGKFVSNMTNYKNLPQFTKKIDIHLMVEDVISYVDKFLYLNPEYITFHVETEDVLKSINYIKNKNIKVGLSLKPDTNIDKVIPYLSYIDLVLVMTVEPGSGGQKFMNEMIPKINELQKLKNDYNFIIEADGGINKDTMKLFKSDIYVIGSYITDSQNPKNIIDELKNI